MSVFPLSGHVCRIHRAVVPVAGLGSRLRPLTFATPKELLPVGRLPVLGHVMEELAAAGVDEALLVVSDAKPQIRAFLGDTYHARTAPVRVDYIVQPVQRGSGDAVLLGREWLGSEPFAVAFGDAIITSVDPSAPLRRLISLYEQSGCRAAVLVQSVQRERVSRYGVVAPAARIEGEPVEPFLLQGIVEKPDVESAPSNLVVSARFVLTAAVLDALAAVPADARGELNLPDAIAATIRGGGSVWAVPLLPGEARHDIGNFGSYFAAFVQAALEDRDFGAEARRAAQGELNRASQREAMRCGG